jgi:hypothetical protein
MLAQHGWLSPPQATHVLPAPHVLNGAVQPTLDAQHASPIPPHVPHAPAAQLPVAPPHAEPEATHVLVL